MRRSTSSLQQNNQLTETHRVKSATAIDRLNALFSDADDSIRGLNRTWQGLMRHLSDVEYAIEQTERQARRLDAFVDDALYAGDAAAARCCADRAQKLRADLARITEQFISNKRLAALLRDNMQSLEDAISG
jgi:phage shock protein A